MEPSEYQVIAALEDRHWWYVGMQSITLALVDRYYAGRSDLQILDAGCGTGGVTSTLGRYGCVTGCDVSSLALSLARRRGLSHLAQASVMGLPFSAEQFDLVASFDVLYHRAVSDYPVALAEFWRVLRPGGRVVLRLPAYDWLRGRHDAVIHTARRFSARELRLALTESRFTVETLSYANMLLLPPALAKRLTERLRSPLEATSDIKPVPPWQNRWLTRILSAEAPWVARGLLPAGLTVAAVARKP